jgi:hypothetical protein
MTQAIGERLQFLLETVVIPTYNLTNDAVHATSAYSAELTRKRIPDTSGLM